MSEEKKTKSEAALLKEKLFRNKKCGCVRVSSDEMKKADEYCEEYKNFLNCAKNEREAVVYAVAKAEKAGFTEYDRTKNYSAGDM